MGNSKPTRQERILTYANTSGKGIEIAPYFNPTLRKSEGYDLLIADVFDTERLRQNAIADPEIADGDEANIEEVDFIGDAGGLDDLVEKAGLTGQIDYVISSHNFEHLPNPIRFLRAVAAALRTGGTLSMAIPDYRTCFDQLRFPTRLSEWLVAYHEDHRQPTAALRFDAKTNRVRFMSHGNEVLTSPIENAVLPIPVLTHDINETYASFRDSFGKPGPYMDAHCTVTTPAIFELYLRDLRYLGLVDLEVIEIMPTRGIEFFAHLRKVDGPAAQDPIAHRTLRQQVLTRISEELGRAGFNGRDLVPREKAKWRAERLLASFIGADRVAALRERGRARRRRRKARREVT